MKITHLFTNGLVVLGLTLLAAGNASATGNLIFFAVLSGGNEVTATAPATGDTDGYGSATVIIDGTNLCFAITVSNIDTPEAAHIHQARTGKTGAVKVTLSPPELGDPGASSGCVDVSSTVLNAIKANPGNFYVNVHTIDFPAGAIRGNLF